MDTFERTGLSPSLKPDRLSAARRSGVLWDVRRSSPNGAIALNPLNVSHLSFSEPACINIYDKSYVFMWICYGGGFRQRYIYFGEFGDFVYVFK